MTREMNEHANGASVANNGPPSRGTYQGSKTDINPITPAYSRIGIGTPGIGTPAPPNPAPHPANKNLIKTLSKLQKTFCGGVF